MTCCIAAKYKGGVLCASDAALTMGDQRIHTPKIKAKTYGSVYALFAGELSNVDRLFSVAPNDDDDFTDVQKLQHRVFSLEKKLKADAYEFLLVDEDHGMHILSGHGDLVSGYEADGYAVIGSELGWLGMDLTFKHGWSKTIAKREVSKVLRAVERRDTSVYKPIYFHEVE